MKIITNQDELINFCEVNDVAATVCDNEVIISSKKIIRSWGLWIKDEVVFTKNGFKVIFNGAKYNEVLSVKLKGCIALIKTKNLIVAISNKNAWENHEQEMCVF